MIRHKYMNNMLKTSEVAHVLNVHINTVRRWSTRGTIRAYRIGPRGDRRFQTEDITGFVQEVKTNRGNSKK